MNVPFLDLKQQYSLIKEEVEPELLKLMESCAYIGGPYVKKFEDEVKEYLGVKHAIGCASGTDALVLGLRACGIKPGDEVITTAFSFFATAEAIAAVGAKPVFIDVKLSDYTIDPALIEDAITERTRAIVPVHIFGAPCDMDSIMEIAKKYNLKVIEDDAQAIGSSYKGKMAGTIGDVGCFSFYPTKNLGACGDGGMVTTNDDQIATNLQALKEHGAGMNGAKAKENLGGEAEVVQCEEAVTELYNPYKYYNYLIGYNSRLDAVQACVLSIKLKHLNEYNSNRARIANRYLEKLSDKLIKPDYSGDRNVCWHQFVVRTENKNELCKYLSEHGVGNGSFYPVPLHMQKAFDETNCVNASVTIANAERLAKETVCLPVYPEMREEEIEYVIETVNKFFEVK